MYEYRIVDYGEQIAIHKIHHDNDGNIVGMNKDAVTMEDLNLDDLRIKSIEVLAALTKPSLSVNMFSEWGSVIDDVNTALGLLR